MTYYLFVVFLAFLCVFSYKKLSRGFTDVVGFTVFFMLLVFSQSNNFDHANYQLYFSTQMYALFEPLFVFVMFLFHDVVEPEFFLATVFVIVYYLCRTFGDNKYNLLALLFLSPLGVVSPRFFFAAMLLSLIVAKRSSLFRYSFPVLTHYSTLPVYSFFLLNRRLFGVCVFSFVGFFVLAKGYFFQFISSFGVDYTRYLESENNFSITNLAKYGILPIVLLLLGRQVMVDKKYFNIALSLFFVANVVKFGMLDFEVMSRVATMFVLLGLYYVYNYGNNIARLFVISYVALNSLTFGFYGWAIYPDIYMESDQWLNGR